MRRIFDNRCLIAALYSGCFAVALLLTAIINGGLHFLLEAITHPSLVCVFPTGLTLKKLYLGNTRIESVWLLSNLTNLEELELQNTQVADIAELDDLVDLFYHVVAPFSQADTTVSPFAKLTNLRVLTLSGTQVKDLTPLSGLEHLEELDVRDTHVSGLAPLSHMTGMERLCLAGTEVADLSPLFNLGNLSYLDVQDSKVSDEEIRTLQQKVPKCIVQQ